MVAHSKRAITIAGGGMPDPIMMSIAAGLAGKAVSAVAGGALSRLVTLVKARFSKEPAAAATLEAAQQDPADQSKVTALGEALSVAAQADPGFAEQVRELWGQVSNELSADRGSVVNQVTGSVGGHVVQARDIQGGISFGAAPPPQA